jgi:hypothetical protein
LARLITSGGEIQDHPTSDIGSPDGITEGATATTTDLSVYRSGDAAFKCAGTSGNTSFRRWAFTAPASGATLYGRIYLRVSALPSSTVKVASFVTVADAALVSVRLTSTGTLELWNDAGAAQIGSATTLALGVDTWYRIQLSLLIAAGATDAAALRVKTEDPHEDDESISGSSLTISDTHASRFRAGWIDAPGVTADAWVDDVAVNDSTTTATNHMGVVQQTWPNDGSIVVCPAWIQIALDPTPSWTDCSGSSTGAVDGLDNIPPIGLADHVTGGHTGTSAHQSRFANAAASTWTVRHRDWPRVGVPRGPNSSLSGAGVTNIAVGAAASATQRAQLVKVGGDLTISFGWLWISRTGSPGDNFVMEMQTDSGGAPSGTVVGSFTVVGMSLSTGGTATLFRFDQDVSLTADTSYWLVARRTGAVDAANYYSWKRETTSSRAVEGPSLVFDGSSWSVSNGSATETGHAYEVYFTQGHRELTVGFGYVCHGQSATGARGGTVKDIAGSNVAKSFDFGDNAGVAGTYPSGWRWAKTNIHYEDRNPRSASQNIDITTVAGSANAVMICSAGVMAEYRPLHSEWHRRQNTISSIFYWCKRVSHDTDFERSNGTIVTVDAGHWAMYPEPQIASGADFPTTLVEETHANIVQFSIVA